MPTFSYREKNDTISVRCGARCRAYHASSMGEGKGSPHNCAAARFLFFGFFNSMESAFSYGESFSVRLNPVRRRLSWRRPPRKALFLRPDVVPHPLQTLVPPSGGTTSLGPNGLSSGRTWCLIPRKPLFLRPEAPRPQARTDFPPGRRGASPPANPCSSVRRHHVLRPERTFLRPDVVPHPPQSLMPSSGSTTPVGSALRRLSWRRPSRKTLTLRRATPTWPGRASGNPGFPFPIRRECDEHI